MLHGMFITSVALLAACAFYHLGVHLKGRKQATETVPEKSEDVGAIAPCKDGARESLVLQDANGHKYVGHKYVGHKCIGHTYVGHNCIGHNCIGHDYTGHNYIGRN